ncbi:uncharacterized protein LOC129618687 [Condylostylus longicornis]|uniref:uncharacterized protein LOC129618687 n=1 Tax=Condylostylus longicornis TaxID=2530218 RepID=UPI00244E53AD|nr:uncharacterized protein LOC129618687 [Condylostylus longicornis]
MFVNLQLSKMKDIGKFTVILGKNIVYYTTLTQQDWILDHNFNLIELTRGDKTMKILLTLSAIFFVVNTRQTSKIEYGKQRSFFLTGEAIKERSRFHNNKIHTDYYNHGYKAFESYPDNGLFREQLQFIPESTSQILFPTPLHNFIHPGGISTYSANYPQFYLPKQVYAKYDEEVNQQIPLNLNNPLVISIARPVQIFSTLQAPLRGQVHFNSQTTVPVPLSSAFPLEQIGKTLTQIPIAPGNSDASLPFLLPSRLIVSLQVPYIIRPNPQIQSKINTIRDSLITPRINYTLVAVAPPILSRETAQNSLSLPTIATNANIFWRPSNNSFFPAVTFNKPSITLQPPFNKSTDLNEFGIITDYNNEGKLERNQNTYDISGKGYKYK